jgi:hypothetical protein
MRSDPARTIVRISHPIVLMDKGPTQALPDVYGILRRERVPQLVKDHVSPRGEQPPCLTLGVMPNQIAKLLKVPIVEVEPKVPIDFDCPLPDRLQACPHPVWVGACRMPRLREPRAGVENTTPA